MLLYKLFGLCAIPSIGFGFVFYKSCLKYKNLQIGTKKFQVPILQMSHDFIFFLKILFILCDYQSRKDIFDAVYSGPVTGSINKSRHNNAGLPMIGWDDLAWNSASD